MFQISFDNLSKKQKILEEDTLYSLYQANQKYEELKKFIIDSKDGEKIELPDITLANENNISLLEITDLTKASINETLTSLLTKAIVIENQIEGDSEKIIEFEKQVKNEINNEKIDKDTGKPKLKERKETTIDKTVKNTFKGKKWVLDLFNKEKKTKKLPVITDNEPNTISTNDSEEVETESTLDRLLMNRNEKSDSELVEIESISKSTEKEVPEKNETDVLVSAATSETVATQTDKVEPENNIEKNLPVIKDSSPINENVPEPVVEDMLTVSIRDSLKMLRNALENPNLTTTERELILYKIDKFNSLSIEAETLIARQNDKYNTTYTEKEVDIQNQLKEELANLLATIDSEKREQEDKIKEKYIDIEKKEKSDYLNSEPEKEAQQVLKENFDLKVQEAKEDMDRQNEIRKNSFFSDIKNSIEERKSNELNNINLNYENLVSDKSTQVRSKYETKFNADMEKLNLELLNEKKLFLNKELKEIEEYVTNNVAVWHDLATKELNYKHDNLTLEKENIQLEIEKSKSLLINQKEKEGFLIEIERLKKEVEEKNKKESRYVENEEKRLNQNAISLGLQNKLIEELDNKKSFMNEVDTKVEETIKKSLELSRKKNEKLKYVLFSSIALTVVSLGLAIYGLSERNSVEGSENVPEQTVEEVTVSSSVEEEPEPEPEPVILSIEEYLNNKDYDNAKANYPDKLDQIEQKIYSDKDLEYLKKFISENSSLYGGLDVAVLENNNDKIIEEYNKIEKKDTISKDRLERVVKAFKDTKKEDEAKKVEELLKE